MGSYFYYYVTCNSPDVSFQNWIDPELEKPVLVHTKNIQDIVTVSGFRCELPFFVAPLSC